MLKKSLVESWSFFKNHDALKQLQTIGDELGTLATDNPTLGESIYAKAKKDFDSTQSEK